MSSDDAFTLEIRSAKCSARVAATTAANGAQILTNPGVDAQGRPTYRLAVANNELIRSSFQTDTGLSNVYQFLLSFRYSFN